MQRTSRGGRILEELHSKKFSSAFTYRIDAPGQKLMTLPDGSVVVGLESRAAGEVAVTISAVVAPAWARDAKGGTVPTRYAVDGDRRTMHVDQSRVSEDEYPVVADPTVTPVDGRRRFPSSIRRP